MATIAMLVIALVATQRRLQLASTALSRMRAQAGYVAATPADKIAAALVPSDEPMTYRVGLRVPEAKGGFRIAYSSIWPRSTTSPQWYGAVPVPPGDSVFTLRITKDPRDDRWKIAALVRSVEGTRRMATVLPRDQVDVFRGSHDVISTGIPRGQTVAMPSDQSIRVLDERWLVGEGSLMLYGDKPPDRDQIGVYAELQPNTGPL